MTDRTEEQHSGSLNRLRVYTAAYLASDTTCSMAERTQVGQDFGSLIWKAEFDILAPGMTESSMTSNFGHCYEQFFGQVISVGHRAFPMPDRIEFADKPKADSCFAYATGIEVFNSPPSTPAAVRREVSVPVCRFDTTVFH